MTNEELTAVAQKFIAWTESQTADIFYNVIGEDEVLELAKAYLRQKELLSRFANLCDGDMSSVGSGTRLGFEGRLTAGMIKDAKAAT